MPSPWIHPTERRACARCGFSVSNRRALVPRFCPECGQRLGPEPAKYPLPPRRRVDGAVSSLILGIFALCAPPLGGLFGLFAIMVGVGARKEIRAAHGRLTGGGFAMTGICLGFVGIISSIGFCGGL